MIELKNISKTYIMKGGMVEALRDVSIEIQRGEFVSIMGPSGSGKSTLLSIIGCLETPSKGSYRLEGREVSSLSDDELSLVRNEKIGFVFQAFHLLPRFNAQENVELPLIYKGMDRAKRKEIAKDCLAWVSLQERLSHLPSELSGGEQQRVAIARALANSPILILADEPTGNLDSGSAQEIMKIFNILNKEKGITIIVVTHNPKISEKTNKVYYLKDGRISDNL